MFLRSEVLEVLMSGVFISSLKRIISQSKACKDEIIFYQHHHSLLNDVPSGEFMSHWCGKVSALMTSSTERFETLCSVTHLECFHIFMIPFFKVATVFESVPAAR